MAAPYIGADKTREERLKAASGAVQLPPTDFVLLVFYLCRDPDPDVKRAAVATLRALDATFLSRLLSNPELHPRILDALVQLHFNKPELAPLFAAHPMLSEASARFLTQKGVPAAAEATPPSSPESEGAGEPAGSSREVAGEAPGEAPEQQLPQEEPVDEESEEFQSKYQLAQSMGVGEKIKMALTGDKEWRSILIKDANKLVSGSVVKNPRMTESEVLGIAKATVQNEEIIRVICANKEWIKNPQIRRALVVNHKTPLPAALRFVATLSEKELSILAKSKNISSVIASQARRILFSKKNSK